eukprot:TRINITY_DN42287_c0_g1_i1.p1 TRINITY_DN42287_c0_g1~~TRINITY_DN42287_c0_g1_i1.p1  ORF type:complete len:390 (-),score=61.76 TRINITY_DN42287_c0_g1_i1:62-1231(-)
MLASYGTPTPVSRPGSRSGTPGRGSFGGPPRPPSGALPAGATDKAGDDRKALKLENDMLRSRIRELELANEELQMLAGLLKRPMPAGQDGAGGSVASSASRASPQGDVKACANCGRHVPAISYEAHLLHCERNFCRCPACGDVMPVRELEPHKEHWRDPRLALKAAEEEDLASLRCVRAHGLRLEEVSCPETEETLLHKGSQKKEPALLAMLLGWGAPAQSWLAAERGTDRRSALHVASALGNETAVALLLESRAVVNQTDGAGETPLLSACRSGQAAVIRRLVDAGADLNARTALGDTAWQVARAHGVAFDCGLSLNTIRRPGSFLAGDPTGDLPAVQTRPSSREPSELRMSARHSMPSRPCTGSGAASPDSGPSFERGSFRTAEGVR